VTDPLHQELVDRLIGLQPRFRRFALGLTGSIDMADELVQNAYERALTRMHQYRPGTRIDSWMFRIIQTVHLNGIQRQNVRNRYTSDVDPETVASPGTSSQPERDVEFDQVREKISALPEDQRVALLLVAVEGLSYKEASQVLDVPIGTVTSRIARARAGLVDALNERPKPVLVRDPAS